MGMGVFLTFAFSWDFFLSLGCLVQPPYEGVCLDLLYHLVLSYLLGKVIAHTHLTHTVMIRTFANNKIKQGKQEAKRIRYQLDHFNFINKVTCVASFS